MALPLSALRGDLPSRGRLAERGEALFGSRTLAWALAYLTLHLGEEISISGLAWQLGADYESAHRAVGRLEDAGLVDRERRGREVLVRMERSQPEAGGLRGVCLQAVSVGPALARAATELGVGAVAAAFVFGSVAAGTDGEKSDLDVMVIGEAHLPDLAPYLRGLGDVLGREIQPVCRTAAELQRRVDEGYGFYANVVSGARIWLVGPPATDGGVAVAS
jgi:predicted nucleotidyltransferase